jgi:hypothetical protein
MFQIDQLGHDHHHIEHGRCVSQGDYPSLKDSSAKDQIGGDETEAVVLAVFEFSRNSICSEVQLLT